MSLKHFSMATTFLSGALCLMLASCAGKASCPTNQASVSAAAKGSPVKSAGALDKNGLFQKKNAYHPSARKAGN